MQEYFDFSNPTWLYTSLIPRNGIIKYSREKREEDGDHRMGTAESDNDRLKLHTTSNEAPRHGSINFARDYAHESKLDRTCQNKMTIDHRHIRQEI